MAVLLLSSTCMRYMPRLSSPVSGSLVMTSGSVMKGPPSRGQHLSTGRRERSTASPLSTTSCTGARKTRRGKKPRSSPSLGSRANTALSPPLPGPRSISRATRSPRASRLGTPMAHAVRSAVPYPPMNTGKSRPFTRSNRRAGPPILTMRSAISVISSSQETSSRTRKSSPRRSRSSMKALRLRYIRPRLSPGGRDECRGASVCARAQNSSGKCSRRNWRGVP
ncbi:hypothetical protein Mrose_03559 [Calidithermus roseus]|uniref:Uncharacterized protein n=1 Tax=Calidithermus roseus TaxID=1644118 RepID=A0A399EA78_9DEIN|nr:hypothetical protein Mrose_03559 [Calidithermus roseus]